MARNPIPAHCARVVFKHEDSIDQEPIGPLWFVTEAGSYVNVEDSDVEMFTGNMAPKWFTRTDASELASSMGLSLEVV